MPLTAQIYSGLLLVPLMSTIFCSAVYFCLCSVPGRLFHMLKVYFDMQVGSRPSTYGHSCSPALLKLQGR